MVFGENQSENILQTGGADLLKRKQAFSTVLDEFSDLHAVNGMADGLAGMKVVKDKIADNSVS